MAEEIKTPETEESGKNFIINFIDEDIAEGGQFQGMTVTPVSRRSLTAICILDTARR